MHFDSIRSRLQRLTAFAGVSKSPLQWTSLSVLGWARGNPSSIITRFLPTLSVRPTALCGGSISVSSRDLGQLISFDEIFVEHIYCLDQVPFTPRLILDCGGHVGYFTTLAGAAYPQADLVVFEPNPENLPWLHRNIAALTGRVTIREAAVSDYNGVCRFSASYSNGGRLENFSSVGFEVRVVDLMEWLPRSNSCPLLLKMDIEGEEKRLLPHILPALPRQCFIFLETHDGDEVRRETIRALGDAGFDVILVRERGTYADLAAVRNTV